MKVKPLQTLALILSSVLFIVLTAGVGKIGAEDVEVDDGFSSFLPITLGDWSFVPSLLYFDDFSDPDSGWPVEDDGVIKWSYRDEQYEMVVRETSTFATAIPPLFGTGDYSIEAEMQRKKGRKSSYGLLFDYKDLENFYLFVVDPGDRQFALVKREDSELKVLIPFTDSSTIKAGREVNILKVERAGKRIDIYVNGGHLDSRQDKGFSGKIGVGFFIESGSDAPASVRYDNFAVREVGFGKQTVWGIATHSSEFPAFNGGSIEIDSAFFRP